MERCEVAVEYHPAGTACSCGGLLCREHSANVLYLSAALACPEQIFSDESGALGLAACRHLRVKDGELGGRAVEEDAGMVGAAVVCGHVNHLPLVHP